MAWQSPSHAALSSTSAPSCQLASCMNPDEADDKAAGCCRSFLVTILKHHPQLTGVLFDQPQVIDKAKGLWAKDPFYNAVAGRVELMGGTFFDAGMAFPAVKELGHTVLKQSVWCDNQTCSVLLALLAGPPCGIPGP